MSIDDIVTRIVFAMALVIGLSSVMSYLFRRLHQPEVIGQLLAGIALGPSLIGRFPGNLTGKIFPGQVMPYLTVISQVALVAFLFAVGYELELNLLRQQRRAVPMISAAALAIPLLLGLASVAVLGDSYRGAGQTQPDSKAFMLFMGVAVSVTAVPVMASIVRERGIATTVPGVVAMTSAGVIDVLSWLLLALVLTMVRIPGQAHRSAVMTALLLAGFVMAALLVVRPALRSWLRRQGRPASGQRLAAAPLALGFAGITAWLGLHVIFGALFAGLIMPRRPDGRPDVGLLDPLRQAGQLLLPVFFVVSGLSVNIQALHAHDLMLFGVIGAIAVVGKLGGGFLGGRAAGLGRRDSAIVGVLLDTRGLTELIALNVGLQAGIIGPRLYTILVLVALATTMATGPLLSLVERRVPAVAAASRPGRRQPAESSTITGGHMMSRTDERIPTLPVVGEDRGAEMEDAKWAPKDSRMPTSS